MQQNQFHRNLKRLRKRARLTQAGFAAKFAGVNRHNIMDWESIAEPSFFRLIQIADYFVLTTDQILKEEIV